MCRDIAVPSCYRFVSRQPKPAKSGHVYFERLYLSRELTLYLAVKCVLVEKAIKLLLLNPLWLELLIARGHVAGYWFSLLASFSAFNDNVFSWHIRLY
jgi:hypothetical protein